MIKLKITSTLGRYRRTVLDFASAQAQKLPQSTTIGSNPAGTVFYAVAAGLAKVISGGGPMQSNGAALHRHQHFSAAAR